MQTYTITSRTGGQILWTGDAATPDAAFAACCRAAGYPDLAATDGDGKLLCDRSDVSIVEGWALTDRAGNPLTDYCLYARPPEFWGEDASTEDADRCNACLAKMIEAVFGLPVRLVTTPPPRSCECDAIEEWREAHWIDAIEEAMIEERAAAEGQGRR